MTARFRPVHSNFETLRHCGPARRQPLMAFGSAANEQMTAMGSMRTTRPLPLFSEFVQR
ncbi:hypothetical protein [Ensifer soli]|uniref:hypothetical protein n=1 Tax=Ciceribacter sp. sgz301302 TaxID=3342379 RepID=UPI0035B81024